MPRQRPPPEPPSSGRSTFQEAPSEGASADFDPDVTVKLTLRRTDHLRHPKIPVLRVVAGPDMLIHITLTPGTRSTLGRDETSTLVLSDPSVSRHHATIHFLRDDEYIVEDHGSTNGTAINGRAVGWSAIRPGDHLEVGTVLLRLDLMSEEEVAHHRKVRARLLHAQGHDPLTGLRTRTFLQDELPPLVKNCHASGIPLCCVFLDVDHFKRVNDRFGHQVGDEVLQAVARLCMLGCRDTDICMRYGGEEFLIFLLGTSETGGLELAVRLCAAVRSHDWSRTRKELRRVTVSLGVAQQQPGESIERWLDRADQAMYCAKRNGRNTVWSASAIPPAGSKGLHDKAHQ